MSRIYRMRNAVYCCAGGLLCLNLLPHALPTFPKRSMGWAGHDPPPELVEHVRKIALVMGLPRAESINVFLSKGVSSMTFGSPWFPNGATIGLSRTVLFRNTEDVKFSLLEMAPGTPIDWESEIGDSLGSSLTPTAEQINFIIAHEVAHLKHHDWVPRTVLPPVVLVAAYHAARSIPHLITQRHTLAGFAAVMALSLAVYLQLTASLSRWQEFRADKMAAQCSDSYAQGGLDHFGKRMKLDSILQSFTKPSTLDRFQPTFSLHPPARDRFERLQSLISSRVSSRRNT